VRFTQVTQLPLALSLSLGVDLFFSEFEKNPFKIWARCFDALPKQVMFEYSKLEL
jgi:hypothetical protein